MKKNKVTFPTALDESGFLVAFPYDVQAIPVSIIINPEGKIEKQVENLQKRERIFVYKFEINFYLWRSIVDKNDSL